MEPYRFQNITYTYPGESDPALKDVSFSVNRGEFVVVCGDSGSGKTTLLKQLKEQNPEFGYVMQNPSTQLVTDKVYHELAFGMENEGMPPEQMWHAIAETATYFGMEDWLEWETFRLSGGEAQLVNLASVLVMNPPVILLDEPTSQLDPMASTAFLEVVKRINEQMGITVIMVEQRLEEVLAACDRMLVLHGGCVAAYDDVKGVFTRICRSELSDAYFSYMPSYVRLYARLNDSDTGEDCPESIKECRSWFYEKNRELSVRDRSRTERAGSCSLECQGVYFRYERLEKDILHDVCYRAYPGHVYGIVGGNGSGKSTFLKVLTGAKKPYHGKVKIADDIAYLPQEPRYLFLQDRIGDIVTQQEAIERFGLGDLLERHPYDVSGGQMQRLSMAYLYEKAAQINLFDEPTKGLDPHWKQIFGSWLEEMAADGKTVVIVTHDVEFAADYCEQMSMFFRAGLTEPMETDQFFQGHHFYTTAVHKIVRDQYPNVVTERSLYEG